MKTINVEGVVLSEKLIIRLKELQDIDQQSFLLESMMKINGFLVDQLNYKPENNIDYVDCLMIKTLKEVYDKMNKEKDHKKQNRKFLFEVYQNR